MNILIPLKCLKGYFYKDLVSLCIIIRLKSWPLCQKSLNRVFPLLSSPPWIKLLLQMFAFLEESRLRIFNAFKDLIKETVTWAVFFCRDLSGLIFCKWESKLPKMFSLTYQKESQQIVHHYDRHYKILSKNYDTVKLRVLTRSSTYRLFQIAYEGYSWSLCTVTFWQKVYFLISNAH